VNRKFSTASDVGREGEVRTRQNNSIASVPENGKLIIQPESARAGRDQLRGSCWPSDSGGQDLLSPTWDESSNFALIAVGVSADADATVTRP
jgi:hypothetical protein